MQNPMADFFRKNFGVPPPEGPIPETGDPLKRTALLAKPMNGINAPQRPDCVADDAVSCELVSAPNSLLTGKLTGNFANSGPQQRFPHLINEPIQRLAAKFPTQRNREFLQP